MEGSGSIRWWVYGLRFIGSVYSAKTATPAAVGRCCWRVLLLDAAAACCCCWVLWLTWIQLRMISDGIPSTLVSGHEDGDVPTF